MPELLCQRAGETISELFDGVISKCVFSTVVTSFFSYEIIAYS